MKKVFFILGGMICSLIIFGIPVLTAISLCLGWSEFISVMGIVVSLGEVAMMGMTIAWKVEDEELWAN